MGAMTEPFDFELPNADDDVDHGQSSSVLDDFVLPSADDDVLELPDTEDFELPEQFEAPDSGPLELPVQDDDPEHDADVESDPVEEPEFEEPNLVDDYDNLPMAEDGDVEAEDSLVTDEDDVGDDDGQTEDSPEEAGEELEEGSETDAVTDDRPPELIIKERQAEKFANMIRNASSSEVYVEVVDMIVSESIDAGASDVYIESNDYVGFKINDEYQRQHQFGIFDPSEVELMTEEIVTQTNIEFFENDMELDTSYTLSTGKHSGRRTRLSVSRSMDATYFVFRNIANVIPSPADLGIHGGPMMEWTRLANGLVMMNGSTGTGKTTTLASLIRQMQMTRPDVILTVEKPIEYTYGKDGMGKVIQREVGRDTRSFSNALDSGMRQNPRIILIGEVRNRVEVDTLIRAAESGHLAISTMHTSSAEATLNRISSLFPAEHEKSQIMNTLGGVGRGFANQVLVKGKDGKRFAVRELLEFNEEVKKLVISGDIQGVRQYQVDNHQTMEHGLVKAVKDNRCTAEAARYDTAYPDLFNKLMKRSDLT